ncbi:MAG: glucose 1-dehydrogenase [Chloroflexota bacterium]
MSKLAGKTAVITGGNSGIGLATAQSFKNEGANVVIFGRNQETLDEAVAQLGGDVLAVQGDVSALDDLDRLYSAVQAKFGGIDVLFVNAGVAFFAPIEASDEAFFDNLMNVNVKGAYFTVQKALPYLHDNGSIILTTSVANQIGMANASVYAATKAAVRSFARTMAAELSDRNIRVNAISPGPIETPLFNRMGLTPEQIQEFAAGVLGQVPLNRFGQSEEIAQAVTFLATSDASFVQGTELVADGGMSQL